MRNLFVSQIIIIESRREWGTANQLPFKWDVWNPKSAVV